MNPDDTVDWTIRNQRIRGWPAAVWIGGWFVVWAPAGVILELLIPPRWYFIAVPSLFLLIVVPLVFIVIHLDRRPRVQRLKLGDQLQAYPRCRLQTKDIRAIHVATDQDEDYAESKLPVPLCQITVESRRRKLCLVVSVGDAARLREWAEQKSVAVIDPLGLSIPPAIGRLEHG